MQEPELHPLAAEVSRLLNGEQGPFVMIVSFQVQPNRTEEFVKAFLDPLKKTVQETGNLTYRLVQEIAAPSQFLIFEHWKNLLALDEHLKQPYLVKLGSDFEELLAAPPEIRVYIEHSPSC